MNVTCAKCGASFFVMPALAGKKVKCGHCGEVTEVPAAAPSAAKPMFRPGSLKLPPKPQLKAGLKLASGVTPAAPAPAAPTGPVSSSIVAPLPTPKPAPAPAPVPEPAPAPVEPAPAPAPDQAPAAAIPPPPPAPASAPAPAGDLASRLTKLKTLFDMGLITSEELAAQRARILSEI